MSHVARYLNESGDALRKFVDQWSRDPVTHNDVREIEWPLQNARKLAFISNESPLEGLIEKEILENYLPVYEGMSYLPLMGEVEEPIFIDTTRKRIQYLLKNVPTWCDFFVSKTIIYFYRRITETTYQTPAHMRVVYAMAAASELAVMASIMIDDEMDDITGRNGITSWQLKSPVSIAGDCILLNELARMVIRTYVPDSHPAKADLIRLIDDTIVEIANYFVLPTFLQASQNDGQPKQGFPFSIELITRDTVTSRTYVRAGKWIYNLFNLPRLAACYTGLRSEDMGIIRDQILRVSQFMCIIDDIRDSPDPEKSLDSLIKDELSDILSCELQNHLLLAALEVARSSSDEGKKNEIFNILQTRYGTNDLDDARIVAALYHKYDIVGHAKDILCETVRAYRMVSQTLAAHINMPRDIIYYLVRFYIIGEKADNTGNNKITGGVLKMFQQLEQSVTLSPMEKEDAILNMVEKM
ncbi:unnamed protein product [Fusarium equiseti]|uniref:Uncharacterized protein n=1 Tax=Fusarium equiseti TaxID=61235 RepID=A0A8J2IZ10_FUSEQ|nr:unnamed protein product [Fusarium equiseti]